MIVDEKIFQYFHDSIRCSWKRKTNLKHVKDLGLCANKQYLFDNNLVGYP